LLKVGKNLSLSIQALLTKY